MLTSVRSLLAATVLASSALVATPAMAQDEEDSSGISISGNAAVVTQYRFRGIGLSDGDFAIQGGIDIGYSGFYVGTWGSSLTNTGTSVDLDDGTGTVMSYDVGGYGAAEIDLYGGWSGDLVDGLSADIGVLYYLYPNASNLDATWTAPAALDYPVFDGYAPYPTDYIEIYGSLSPSIGPVDLTVGIAYAPTQDSLGGTDNLYIYGDVGVGIPSTPISLSGHVGYTDGFLTVTASGHAVDWSIGADLALTDNLSVGVAYVGVEDDGADIPGFTSDAVVGTVSVSF